MFTHTYERLWSHCVHSFNLTGAQTGPLLHYVYFISEIRHLPLHPPHLDSWLISLIIFRGKSCRGLIKSGTGNHCLSCMSLIRTNATAVVICLELLKDIKTGALFSSRKYCWKINLLLLISPVYCPPRLLWYFSCLDMLFSLIYSCFTLIFSSIILQFDWALREYSPRGLIGLMVLETFA